jgi:hypothetical protein
VQNTGFTSFEKSKKKNKVLIFLCWLVVGGRRDRDKGTNKAKVQDSSWEGCGLY